MKPRRLILSRKGFDSGKKSGNGPSPIFHDDTMFSLPIPQAGDNVTYRDLRHGDRDIGKLVEDITRRHDGTSRIGANDEAHFDPDINFDAYVHRKRCGDWEDWRGAFGQAGGAATHLREKGVRVGDLFLFFGLYRRVEETQTGWRFVRGAPKQHVLWGWLQIGEIHEVDSQTKSKLPWARCHPHLQYDGSNNVLYVASDQVSVGNRFKAPGAGLFPKFHERLVLTDPKAAKQGTWSYWRLPRWFYPDRSKGKEMLSWLGDNLKRWGQDDEYAYLQSVARGQELVLDLEHYPEALGWVSGLVGDLG